MRRVLVLAAAAGLVLAACGSGQDPTIEPGTATTAAPASTTVPVATTAFEGGLTPVSTPRTETALLDQVTLGRHDGFDRVVFRFTNLVPGYRIGPANPPFIEDGSGKTVTVKGAAFLEVVMTAAGYDTTGDGKQTYTGPNRVTGDASVVAEVAKIGDFEATLSWVIGLGSVQAFRVTTVSNPPRLVIDIKSG